MRTRRWFLRTSGLAVGVLGTSPAWLVCGEARAATRRRVLVVVFQRGAADALNIVAPFFEPQYYRLRPGIAVPLPGASNGVLDLDGRFALNPSLRALAPMWAAGRLAVVHATGSPDTSRSHAEAQDFMESGTAGSTLEEGWLTRAMRRASGNRSPLRALATGTDVPRTLRGGRGAVALDDLSLFEAGSPQAAAILERLYGRSGDARLEAMGQSTFEALRAIEALRREPYTPAGGAQYQGDFGRRLQMVARLVKADVGVEVAFADIDGWDHHASESQQLAAVLPELGQSLAAFATDLGDRMSDVVVVTMSEFGRTAAENGTGGTDHGHGSVMMVMGGPVRGGRVYGTWPGLEPEQLFEGRDLAVTTDFRDVLAELVRDHLGQPTDGVFPGHAIGAPLGLLQT